MQFRANKVSFKRYDHVGKKSLSDDKISKNVKEQSIIVKFQVCAF